MIPDEDLSPAEPDPPAAKEETRSRIDKSVLALPEAKRLRDKQHLRFVARQPCLVCGREPCDPHHLRFAQPHGLGQKVSDEFTVPLCRAHHRELHRAGKENEWWSRNGLEPLDSRAGSGSKHIHWQPQKVQRGTVRRPKLWRGGVAVQPPRNPYDGNTLGSDQLRGVASTATGISGRHLKDNYRRLSQPHLG